MKPTQIYCIAAGGMFLTLFLYQLSSSISHWIQDRTVFYIFKYLIYLFIYKRRYLLPSMTRLRFTLLLIYWTDTAICNVVGVRTISQADSRAEVLFTINLISLFFADRLSFAADLFGLSLQTYIQVHDSIECMTIIQRLIHILIFITRNALHFKDSMQFYDFLISMRLPFVFF